jgi:hypothetical protein
MERYWSLGQASWAWPDDVDETACAGRMADRYLPIEHTGYGGSGWQVAKVFVDEDDAEMLADARLIAAAPELLQHLRECFQMLEDYYDAMSMDGDEWAILASTRAIIAKAEGRTNED